MLVRPGAYGGWGGIVYTLTQVAGIFRDPPPDRGQREPAANGRPKSSAASSSKRSRPSSNKGCQERKPSVSRSRSMEAAAPVSAAPGPSSEGRMRSTAAARILRCSSLKGTE